MQNGIEVRRFVKDVVTLPQLFHNNGYRSMRIGKIYHLGIPGDVGKGWKYDDPESWDYTFNPKGDEFTKDGDEFDPTPKNGQGFRRTQVRGEGEKQHDYQAADEAIRLLNENKDRPFFLACGFVRPHVPEVAPKKFFDLYDAKKMTLPTSGREGIPEIAFHLPEPNFGMDEEQCRESKRAYYASVSFMDAQLGRIVDELDRLKLADKTIIVFISDHGYLLGEHQCWQKLMLFEEACRIPTIYVTPDMTARGKVAKGLVEHVDLYPTIAELAGVKPDTKHPLEGKSQIALLKDPDAKGKDAAFTQVNRPRPEKQGRVEGRSVRTDRYRYTEWGGGKDGVELYDQESDPEERKNLANDAGSKAIIARLQKILHDGPAK